MKTLHVNVPGYEYDIVIGQNILKDAAAYVGKIAKPAKTLIVTDENVHPLYGKRWKTH